MQRTRNKQEKKRKMFTSLKKPKWPAVKFPNTLHLKNLYKTILQTHFDNFISIHPLFDYCLNSTFGC